MDLDINQVKACLAVKRHLTVTMQTFVCTQHRLGLYHSSKRAIVTGANNPILNFPIAKHYELKRYLLQQQLYHRNQDDKTRRISKLYSECWTIWDSQQEQQKLKSTKRKRNVPTETTFDAAAAKFTVDDDGILVLDDSSDDDDYEGVIDDQNLAVVATSKTNNNDNKKVIEIDLLDDDEEEGAVEDDNCKKPKAVHSVTQCDRQRHANNGEDDDVVVDLT